MVRITQHPLRSKADALVRALVARGFTLFDDRTSSEVRDASWGFPLLSSTAHRCRRAIALEEDGRYALRTNLLADQLDAVRRAGLTRACAVGRVFDGDDASIPCRQTVEGVIVESALDANGIRNLWRGIARSLYGITADAAVEQPTAGVWEIRCAVAGREFPLATMGMASEIARALLGLVDGDANAWLFSVDVDALAQADGSVESREALYRPIASFAERFEDDAPAAGGTFAAQAVDVLRAHGYREFFSPGLYEQDAYRKMNMIMESWDLNNRGALLQTPLGRFSRVPTVLTPALEDALEANFKAGEEHARIFEVAHHYLLRKIGAKPELKTSLSFAAYGPDLDRAAFRREVGDILDDLGVSNHFFIPTDMAIPYEPDDCYVVLDERMRYLDGNFGSICQKARDAHGIGTPAFMAQIELPALERKAAEEAAFVAPETR